MTSILPAGELSASHPDVYSWASTFDLTTRDEPGWAARVTAALDETAPQRGLVRIKLIDAGGTPAADDREQAR